MRWEDIRKHVVIEQEKVPSLDERVDAAAVVDVAVVIAERDTGKDT